MIQSSLSFRCTNPTIHDISLRVVLLILVLLSNNCLWVVEQPRQSLLAGHRRFNWLINHVCYASYSEQTVGSCNTAFLSHLISSKVFSASFWMQLHGHPSPKPTTCWSNMPEINLLDVGKLTKAEKEKRTTLQTTRHLPCMLHA